MALNEALFKRLVETPGVPGREEQQRVIAREELGELTDEVRTDAMGNVIGTKRGRDDVRVMIAAHMDEIGFLVKYIDDKGFAPPANARRARPGEHGRAACARHDGEWRGAAGALQPRPQAAASDARRGRKMPQLDEFFVDLGMSADAVKAAVRVGDYVTMDRTFERVGDTLHLQGDGRPRRRLRDVRGAPGDALAARRPSTRSRRRRRKSACAARRRAAMPSTRRSSSRSM